MKFCVLGLGKTGHAMMAYLLDKGQEAIAWNRSEGKVADVLELGITASGAINGYFKTQATTDIGKALKNAKYILVMSVANAHKDIAKLLSGKLEKGSRIIIFNGCWGAYEFYSELKDELNAKNVLLAETSGMLIMSSYAAKAAPRLSTIKKEIAIASIPKEDAKVVAEELKDVFPQFIVAANAIETSINNSNFVLHCPISLLNMARLENGEEYGFYTDAVSKSVARFIEAVDEERVNVAKAIGVTPQSCLEILNHAWGQTNATLYDAIMNNEDYRKIKGPKSLDFRFISEDLPYGFMPVANIGKQVGVKTEAIDAMISVFRYSLSPENQPGTGPDFSKMDLSTLL